MEMLERCPGCSVTREIEPNKAETGPSFVSSSRRARPCAHCGYDGPFQPASETTARDSLPSFAGARAKLATATQDLFRLSGSHSLPSPPNSTSIPVETSASAPPSRAASDSPTSSSRKAESSIMFSLEALMKATQAPPREEPKKDDVEQLWSLQAAEPLFGTAADEALLTTPLKMEPAQSMDSMTLPSEAPNGRRWWPIALAAMAGLVLASGGIWVFGSGGLAEATAASEQAKIEAQPVVEPPAVLPAPPSADEPAAEPPAQEAAAAPAGEPSAPPASDAVGDEAEKAGEAAQAGADAEPESAKGAEAEKSSRVEARRKEKPSSRKAPARAKPRAVAPVMSKTIVPFDKNAARAALNEAASKAAGCNAGGAPGKGKVQVTFGVNGKVSDAQLVGATFAGTTAGSCALKHFRNAKIPAFAGSPVTVAKSFQID